MKGFFKNKQVKKLPKAPEPRAFEEIQKEYTQLSSRAAQSQYQMYVFSKDLEQVNERLMQVNQEAAARQAMDKAAAEKSKQEETPPRSGAV